MRWPAQLTANCSVHLRTALGHPNDVIAVLSLAILAQPMLLLKESNGGFLTRTMPRGGALLRFRTKWQEECVCQRLGHFFTCRPRQRSGPSTSSATAALEIRTCS